MHFAAQKPSSENAVTISELSQDEGEQLLQENGEAMQKYNDYASDYMAVYPMNKLLASDSHLSISLKLKKDVSPKDVLVYHSPDMKSWYPVAHQQVKDGKVSVKVESGI